MKIADWGLADFYHQGKPYNVRVASRYFKAPELLIGMTQYDYQVDLWSVGCMLAGMIFVREPFFKGSDNNEQLIKIAKVVGTQAILEYSDKFDVELNSYFKENLQNFKRKPWDKFINATNENLSDDSDCLDLLDKLLTVDHSNRIDRKSVV